MPKVTIEWDDIVSKAADIHVTDEEYMDIRSGSISPEDLIATADGSSMTIEAGVKYDDTVGVKVSEKGTELKTIYY